LRIFVNIFAPLSFLPLIFWEKNKKFLEDNKHWILYFILIFFSTFLGSDQERLMAPSFLFFYLVIALLVQENLKNNFKINILISICCYLCSFHHLMGNFLLINRDTKIQISLLSLLVVSSIGIYAQRKEKAKELEEKNESFSPKFNT